jgi:hypothetical protein
MKPNQQSSKVQQPGGNDDPSGLDPHQQQKAQQGEQRGSSAAGGQRADKQVAQKKQSSKEQIEKPLKQSAQALKGTTSFVCAGTTFVVEEKFEYIK